MKNCLVTKLKGVVDNDNLEVFGSFKVFVPAGTTFSIDLSINDTSNPGMIVDCDNTVDDILFVNSPTPITFPYTVPSTIVNPRFHIDNPNGATVDTTFTFNNLYSGISRFVASGQGLTISDSLVRNINNGNIKLKYIAFTALNVAVDFTNAIDDALSYFLAVGMKTNAIKLDLTRLSGPYSSITEFGLAYDGAVGANKGNLIGTVSDLVRLFPNLSSRVLVYHSKISGDISGFAATPNITNMAIQATSITGTVESLVEGICATGRTEGTLHCAAHSTAVTFHNAAVPSIGGANPGLQIAFTSTGATVSQGGVTLATYVTAGDTWTYNN